MQTQWFREKRNQRKSQTLMGLEPNAWIWSSRVSFSPVLNVTFCFEFASFSGSSFPSGDKSLEIGSGFTLSLQGGWVYLIILRISRWSTKSTRNKNPSQSVIFGQSKKCCEWLSLDMLLLFSGSAMFDSLWPLGQHARLPCPRYLPEFAQIHVKWISDAMQPFHPLSPPSLPALNLSQHQERCSFQWCSLH